MKLRISKISLLIGIFLSILPINALASSFAERADVKEFIEDMALKHNYNKNSLYNIFNKYDSSQEVLSKLSKPYESLTWPKYKKLFITKQRINDGVKFWKEHAKAIAQAQKEFQVPAEIIVAIIGTETSYGKATGNYPVLQSLATIAFDYPKRSSFFKKELEEYLLLVKEQNLDPITMKGSYTGAIGIPQFMPSSYRKYAINLNNKDGKIDIANNTNSAIASVANYFKMHGWEPNGKIVHKAKVSGNSYKNIISATVEKPKYTINKLRKNNIHYSANLQPQLKLSLIELDLGNKKDYFLVENNFYVITLYNKSYNYAMVVYELSKALKVAKAKQKT